MPGTGDVDQVDADLRVLDPPRGAGALTGHPDRQVLDDLVPQVVTHTVVVPASASQQMLHRVRAGVPRTLGQRPAVWPAQPRQQRGHEPRRMHTRLSAGEPWPDTQHHLGQLHPPPINLYADGRSHRKILTSRHNP